MDKWGYGIFLYKSSLGGGGNSGEWAVGGYGSFWTFVRGGGGG